MKEVNKPAAISAEEESRALDLAKKELEAMTAGEQSEILSYKITNTFRNQEGSVCVSAVITKRDYGENLLTLRDGIVIDSMKSRMTVEHVRKVPVSQQGIQGGDENAAEKQRALRRRQSSKRGS